MGYTDDGHVILTDTDIDVNAQIDPKNLESVTKDKFNAWRQNAIDSSIGAELDAEDAQRANDDAAKTVSPIFSSITTSADETATFIKF